MPNPMYHGETPELQLQRPAQPPMPPPPTWGSTPGAFGGRMRCQANPDGDFHCLHLHHERGAGAYCCFCGKNEKDLHGPYLKGTR